VSGERAWKKWTAGLKALRGGHQSRSDRPCGRIPWWSAEWIQGRREEWSPMFAWERPGASKFVMECRHSPGPKRGGEIKSCHADFERCAIRKFCVAECDGIIKCMASMCSEHMVRI